MIFEIEEFLKIIAFRYTNSGKPSHPYLIETSQLSKLTKKLKIQRSQKIYQLQDKHFVKIFIKLLSHKFIQ